MLACSDVDAPGDELADALAESGGAAGESDVAATDDAGDDTDTSGCFPQSAECAQMIECLDVLVPDADLDDFNPEGACWCGSEAEASACHELCVEQLALAVEQHPTLGACHGRACPLDELDTTVPYRPWPCTGQHELEFPSDPADAPVPGSYCAPICGTGFAAGDCPDHPQTVAEGTCFWIAGDVELCALRCFVDPFLYASGSQCQCGATCQPYGGNDGDGNARGICTFE
jgi:hypothetical protein